MTHSEKNISLRRFGVVIWVSFVASCVASVFFFAMFDPELLGEVTTWNVSLSRLEGYSIGFILFWLLSFSTAWVTAIMLDLPKEKLGRSIHEHQDDCEYQGNFENQRTHKYQDTHKYQESGRSENE